ncbi:N-acetylglucosamine-binding protein GbpA [Microbulbifer sp. MKSA007]|uniref:N-acetylglucosamine-binding protein GbpA n=1 Tax=Microbulbifer sp. SSSA008 TaxID=3243380 RepID=UPI002B2EE3E6|nr:N-acetylglucosamine-binding protein GbpA [Microbulbifer sp. MKSA007]
MILRKKKLASVFKQPIVNRTLMAVVLAGASSNAFSHGYVEAADGGVASARGTLCKYALDTGEMNLNCGAVQWEPQSIEGPEGFPDSGPADGQIASGGSSAWSELNEQTSDRWVKNYISSGWQTFKWYFTANHVTRDWKYYITKEDWNPNSVLTRDQFDLDPFCEIDGNYEQPDVNTTHECQVPDREGYHVILAVWDVGDTVNAFYNVIDVEFDGDNVTNTEWSAAGTINPAQDLNVGDKVYTRVFDGSGENSSYSTVLEIASEEQGIAENWSHDLAELINAEQTDIRAGDFDGDNSFEPLYGINRIYLKDGSGLENVEIGYELSEEEPNYEVTVSGLESEYTITGGAISLDLALSATGDVSVEVTVVNHGGDTLSSYSNNIDDGDTASTSLTLSETVAGHHMVVVVVKDRDGNMVDQNTLNFYLVEDTSDDDSSNGDDDSSNGDDDSSNGDDDASNGDDDSSNGDDDTSNDDDDTSNGDDDSSNDDDQSSSDQDYDYVFPRGHRNYAAGTKVLGRDGNVYECKDSAYSHYCKEVRRGAKQFEPGVGGNWEILWERL